MTRRRTPPEPSPSEWRRTLLRIVAMITTLALAALAVSMTTWDAEGASRIILGAIAAVLIILKGPRSGLPPAVAVVLAAELLAQAAHALALMGAL